MPDDEHEDLIDVGSERGVLLGARWRRHPATRVATVLALLAAAVVALVTRQGTHRTASPRPPVAAASTPTASPPSASPPSAAPTVGGLPMSDVADASLYTVPPEDLRAFLQTHARTCRSGCETQTLTGNDLRRATAAFAGIAPLAGAVVRRHGSVIFQAIEARAVPDALVHLLLQRAAAGVVTAPVVADRDNGQSRTVTVRQIRGGWRLTAELVVRGSPPPSTAALEWSSSTRLPM